METRHSNSPPPTKSSHDTAVLLRATCHWIRAPEQTPQHQMMTMRTSLPSPASRPQPSRPETCDRYPSAPPGATCSPMNQHTLELEGLFEDHGVCSCTIADSLSISSTWFMNNALWFNDHLQPYSQLTNRQRGVQFLFDLTIIDAFPAQNSEFTLQIIDLTQV